MPLHASSRRLPLQPLRRVERREDDALIAGAAAEIAGDRDAHLLLGWVGIVAQELSQRDQHSGRAEAALQAVIVAERLDLAAGLAGLAQELVIRTLTDERPLDIRGADRRRAHAAERERSAGDLTGAIFDQQCCRRYDREIAMPAGELHKPIAMRPW